jgi:hypothetical protein
MADVRMDEFLIMMASDDKDALRIFVLVRIGL